MVNTEQVHVGTEFSSNYNILNIVVNTEPNLNTHPKGAYYNILNIVVNTEPVDQNTLNELNYNILNIVVNTELK